MFFSGVVTANQDTAETRLPAAPGVYRYGGQPFFTHAVAYLGNIPLGGWLGSQTYSTRNCNQYTSGGKWLHAWGKTRGWRTVVEPRIQRLPQYRSTSQNYNDGSGDIVRLHNTIKTVTELLPKFFNYHDGNGVILRPRKAVTAITELSFDVSNL